MALISLDVFDTAIFRKVFKPTDIFHIVEDEVGHNFYNLRIEAQNKARKKSIFYNIFDIYRYIPQFDLKEEIKAEYVNCYANPYILDMYNNSKDEFIFISDMYLPEKVIIGMLERCGYKNPKVFVSCDYNAMKGDGKLFKVVEGVIGRKIDKHIGDNYNCDILGAKKAGIKETEYIGPAIYNKEVVTPELSNPKLRKLLIDEELSKEDIAEKIGYLFAPLVLSFTKKVLDEATYDQTIFFNARDSFLMYVVARWILKTDKKIKYCRFSRRSNFIADIDINYPLNHPNNALSLRFFKVLQVKSVRDFLELFDLNEKTSILTVLEKYQITIDTNLEFNKSKSSIIEEIVLKIQSEIYVKAKKEKANFLKYMKNIEMKDNDIFVDSGYRGTLQGAIHRISGIKVKGTYITVLGGLTGSYYDYTFTKSSFLPLDRPYGGALLETVLTERIGTNVGYTEEGKPILSKDSKARKDISKKVLRGVLRGCEKLYNEKVFASSEDCATVFKRLIDFPTVEEATFGNQPLFENGSNKDNSIVWFNRPFIKEGKLKECYNKSYWKNAFKVLLENDPELKFLRKEIGR